jgi:hypothetical protein
MRDTINDFRNEFSVVFVDQEAGLWAPLVEERIRSIWPNLVFKSFETTSSVVSDYYRSFTDIYIIGDVKGGLKLAETLRRLSSLSNVIVLTSGGYYTATALMNTTPFINGGVSRKAFFADEFHESGLISRIQSIRLMLIKKGMWS